MTGADLSGGAARRDADSVRGAMREGRLMLSVTPGGRCVLLVRPGRDRPDLAAMTWGAFAEALTDVGGAG